MSAAMSDLTDALLTTHANLEPHSTDLQSGAAPSD
jgi:hypothetical protein